jgi:hypothetical protein
MQVLKTYIGILILTSYLVAGGFMLVSSMDHHETSGCPFMPGEHAALCQMTATDHISAWQSMFAAVVPTMLILGLLAAVFVATWRHWYPPPDIPTHSFFYTKQKELVIIPLFQQLFSDGILHPKIP